MPSEANIANPENASGVADEPTSNPLKNDVPEAERDSFEYPLKPMLEKDTVQCNAWKDEVQNILIFVCSTLHCTDAKLMLNHVGWTLLSGGNCLHHREL